MKKMNKLLTLAAIASVALAGCSKNDMPEVPATDAQIRFGAEALTVETKAPFEGEISGSNELKARIIGSKTSNDYSDIYKDADEAEAKGDVTFTDNGTTESGFSTGVKWPALTSTTVFFRGFYPGSTTWTTEATKASAAVDGKTDLMLAPQISGSQQSVVTEGNPLLFKFSHLLTKLHVKVVGNASTASEWGNIVKISLSKAVNADPVNKVEYTYADESTAFSGSVETPFYQAAIAADKSVSYTDDAFEGLSYVIPADGTATLAGYSLVAPVTAVDGSGGVKDEFTLNITTTEGTATGGKDIAINLKGTDGKDFTGSTAGKKFDITIQFRTAGQITATATVTDWVDGGSGNGQM